MNGAMHTDMTERVALAVLNDAAAAKIIASTATFPDDVDDIQVEGVGTHIVGKTFCSVTHFDDENDKGYCWKRDASVHGIDLPNRGVLCLHNRWASVFRPTTGHPMRALDGEIADEMTFASSFSMASWIQTFCVGRRKSHKRALGCAIHLVQDCTRHHAKMWMLKGHATHEAQLQDRWFSPAFLKNRGRIIAGAVKMDSVYPPAVSVQMACREARSSSPSAGALDSTIMRAVRYTAATLRWWSR